MSDKYQLYFKDPDIIFEIIAAQPDDEQDDFSDRYFEDGDYGVVEVDLKTLACRLLPREDWD